MIFRHYLGDLAAFGACTRSRHGKRNFTHMPNQWFTSGNRLCFYNGNKLWTWMDE